MSRVGEAVALAISCVLHGALLCGVLVLPWHGYVRAASVSLVELVESTHEPSQPQSLVAAQPRFAAPLREASAAVARQVPAAPRPPETRRAPVDAGPRAPAQTEAAQPPPAQVEEPARQVRVESAPRAARESGATPGAPRGGRPSPDTAPTNSTLAGGSTPDTKESTAQASPAGVSTPPDAVAALPPQASVLARITQPARPSGGYQVRPLYPAAARKDRAQGTTLLRVHILTDGRVGEVQVERSAGHPALDQAATDAVSQWHFEPARNATEPVAVWVVIPVEFRLTGDF